MFCTLLDNLFSWCLDKFVVVLLEDIVVYIKMLEEHITPTCNVQDPMGEQSIIEKEKCYFVQEEN